MYHSIRILLVIIVSLSFVPSAYSNFDSINNRSFIDLNASNDTLEAIPSNIKKTLFFGAENRSKITGDSSIHEATPMSSLNNGRLQFEENIGQFSEQVLFRANDAQATHFFLDGEIRTAVKGAEKEEGYVYAMEFVKTSPDANFRAIGGKGQKNRKSYITDKGSFPNVPLHNRLRYENLWEGVNTVFYEIEGQMKYDFHVAPKTDPNTIQMVMKGAEDLKINDKGELEFSTSIGRLTKGTPYTYQMINGRRVTVEAGYQISGDTLSFALGTYNDEYPLIIDPIALKWAAFLDGGEWEPIDSYFDPISDKLYITGFADSDVANFNTPSIGPINTSIDIDIVVMCIEKDGSTVLWTTIIGGSLSDEGHGIYVNADGDVFLKGTTRSTDFPINGTVTAFDATHNGNNDQFVMRLGADGTTLKYSSYFGGDGNNYGNYLDHGIVVIGDNIYGSGTIRGNELPDLPSLSYTPPVLNPDPNDGYAGIYSINTTVAGTAGLEGFALFGLDVYGADDIQKDAAGNIYISGTCYDYNDAILTSNAVQTVADIAAVAPEFINGGGMLPVVAKFNSTLTELLYASYVMPTFLDAEIYGQARQMISVNDGGDIFMMTDQYLSFNPDDNPLLFGPVSGETRDLSNTDFSNYAILRSLAKIPASNPSTYSFINVLPGEDFYVNNLDLGLDSKGRVHVLNFQYAGSSSNNYSNYPTKANTTSGAVVSNSDLLDQGNFDLARTYSIYSSTGALLYGTILPNNGESYNGALEVDEVSCTAYVVTQSDGSNDSQPLVTPSYRDPETGLQVNVANTSSRPSANAAYIAVFHEAIPTDNSITDFQAGNNTFCVGSLIYQDPNDGPVQGSIPAYTSGDGSAIDHNLPDLLVAETGTTKSHPTPKSPKGTYLWQVSRNNGSTWDDIAGSNLPVLKPETEVVAGTVQYRRAFITGCCDTLFSNQATATIAGNIDLIIDAPIEPVYYCPGTLTDLGINISNASGNISWQWYNGFVPLTNAEISPASGSNLDQASFTANISTSQTTSGFYRLVVTDAGGCKKESSVTISSLSAQAGSAASMPICPGNTSNDITLGPGAVNPAFDYLWSGPSSFTSTDPNPVVSTAGTYTLQVSIAGTGNFCVAGETSVDVTAFAPHDPALVAIQDAGFCQSDDPAPIGLSGTAPSGYVFQWSPGINIDNQLAYNPNFDPGNLPFDITPIAEVEYTFTALRDDGCIFETSLMVTDTALALANAGSDRGTCGPNSVNLGRNETTGLFWQWSAVSTTYPSGLAALIADPAFTIDGVNTNLGTNKFALVSAPEAVTDCYEVIYVLEASYVPFPTNCLTRDTVKVIYCPPNNCDGGCPEVSGTFTGSNGYCSGSTAAIYTGALDELALSFTTYSVDGVVQPANTPPMGLFEISGGSQGAAIAATGPHPKSVIVNFDDVSWGWAGANVVTYQLDSYGFIGGTEVDCSLLFQVFSGQNAQPAIGILDKSLCAFPNGSEFGNSGLGVPYTVSGVDYSQAPNSGLNWNWAEVGGTGTTVTSNGDTPFPVLEPTSTTDYRVIATDPVTGCPAHDTMTVSVVNVIADAGPDISGICQGSLVQLGTNEQPNHTYDWNPSTGLNFPIGVANSMTAQPFLTVPNAPSGVTYSVTVTEGTTGCQATDDIVLTTTADPPAQPTARSWNICTEEDVTISFSLTGSALTGHTYNWSVLSGGGNLAWFDDPSIYEPTVTVPQGTVAGAYVFRLTITKGSCGSVTQDYTINVVDVADVDLGVDVTPSCTMPYTELSTTADPNYRYSWLPTSGLFTDAAGTTAYTGGSVSANHTMYVEPSGADKTYTITATRLNYTGCINTDMITVLSATPEEVNAGSNDSYCPGDLAYAIGEANTGTSHLWEAVGYNADPSGTPATPSAGEATTMNTYLGSTTSNQTSFSQSSGAPGVYVYRLTSTFANGCSLSDEVTIKVPNLDSGFAGPTQAVCEGESVQLGSSSIIPGYSYVWSALNPNTEDYTIQDINTAQAVVSPVVTTTYQVIATNSETGCEVIETVLVTITPKPTIDDVSLAPACSPINAVDLTAQIPSYNTYSNPVWYVNIIAGAVEATPSSVTPSQTTDYFVILENDFGCPDTAQITVNVENPQDPIIVSTAIADCTTLTVDLNDFQGSPSDVSYSLEWHNANNTNSSSLLSSTIVGAGTYYLFERTPNDCFSSGSSITVSDDSCPLYSIGNQVFNDTDNSGDLNGVEPGIDGVQLQLLDGDGMVYDSDPNTTGTQPLIVTTANGGYYRFDELPVGSYIVEVLASNFNTNNSLENLLSSTGSNQEANPNMDGDSNDNGLDGLVSGAIRSDIIILSGIEPLGESEPGSYDSGSTTGVVATDEANNLTVDFGFYGVCALSITQSSQSPCIDNNTPTNTNDDYFTIDINATSINASAQYQVVIGANGDGTGGTVLGTSNYGSAITVGTSGIFASDGSSTYLVTVRDAIDNTCFEVFTTTVVANCFSCPTPVCLPVQITINN